MSFISHNHEGQTYIFGGSQSSVYSLSNNYDFDVYETDYSLNKADNFAYFHKGIIHNNQLYLIGQEDIHIYNLESNVA